MDIPYELLIKYCRKQTNYEEDKQVSEWLSEGNNFELFDELQKEWKYINDEYIYIPEKPLMWSKIQKKITHDKQNVKKTIYLKTFISAAVVTIILAVSVTIYFSINKGLNVSQRQITEIGTKQNEKLHTELSDGTSIWINSNSSISFDEKYNVDKREITLDGELFIDVQPSDKMFIINTDKIKLEVLGTSFNIRDFKKEELIKIELINGKVRITDIINGQKLLDMIAPQYIEINKKDMTYISTKNNKQASNIWINEYMIIDNEPLYNVFDKLENWYGINIFYSGLDTTKNYTFQLQNEDIYEFLEMFSFITPIDYRLEGKELYIEDKNVK